LPSVFKGLNIEGKMGDLKIIRLWDNFLKDSLKPALSKKLQEYTFVHRIDRERDLVIGVRSAVMANELQFLKPMLEKKFFELLEDYDLPHIRAILFELRT
ncbi:MAG: hypothetical protein OXU45_04895, partial [Candidatus Melainabacteria bacterium]|nr:hypothetical protein [Candidatus Melainabacteria bacterium]